MTCTDAQHGLFRDEAIDHLLVLAVEGTAVNVFPRIFTGKIRRQCSVHTSNRKVRTHAMLMVSEVYKLSLCHTTKPRYTSLVKLYHFDVFVLRCERQSLRMHVCRLPSSPECRQRNTYSEEKHFPLPLTLQRHGWSICLWLGSLLPFLLGSFGRSARFGLLLRIVHKEGHGHIAVYVVHSAGQHGERYCVRREYV